MKPGKNICIVIGALILSAALSGLPTRGAGIVFAQTLYSSTENPAERLVKEGDAAYRIGKYAEALSMYKDAVSEDASLSNKQSLNLRMAMSLYYLKDFSSAITHFQKAKNLPVRDGSRRGSAFHEYIDYYTAMTEMLAGDYSAAAALFSVIPEQYPSSFVKNEASFKAGRLNHILGNYSESNRLLLPLENVRNIEAGRTATRYYIAMNFLNTGDEENGISGIINILNSSPSDTFALKSADRLIGLRTDAGGAEAVRPERDHSRGEPPLLSERETVLLASVYNSHAKEDRAHELLDGYFERFAGGEYTGRAHFEQGKVHYSRRRYENAITSFEEAFSQLKDPGLIRESRLYIARSYNNSGDRAASDREYERFAREYPSDRKAAESLYLIALNLERRGELLKASEEYRKIAGKPAPNAYRDRALFRTGFTLYKSDYLTRSSEYFNGLKKQYSGTELANQAAFWEAKALEKLGKSQSSQDIFSKLSQISRRSYYAVAAREKSGHTVDFVSGESLTVPVIPQGMTEAVEIGFIFGEPWGSRELRRFRRGANVTKQSLIELYHALAEMGTYKVAVQTADLLYNKFYYGSNNVDVLRWLYPKPYSELLDGIPEASRVEESLIFGVMRRESLFELKAVSSAGALGLMQLMPSTAVSLARSIGLQDFSVSEVFMPAVNMHLGIRNIHDLMQRFRRNVPLVLAAYNAGDSAVRRWVDRYGTDDMDEFIENIEYSETRTFVKEVLKNYYFYDRLYSDESNRN